MPRKAQHPNNSSSHSKPTPSKGGGQLRIIAGDWRGRKLPVADLPGLRPTSDRIRETVFNWLNHYIPNAAVLDCFSGTGALSFEALSRGAKSVTMLERATPAAQTLKNNLTTLKTSKADVINTDSLQWLQKPASKAFDIIFLDPPFRMGLLEQTCQLLESNGYLHEKSLIYIEAEKELSPFPVPPNWQPLKSKTGGQVCFTLWSKKDTK
ncbi:16S rRNA (guanine(966)-N(2))-methyltransferase RsmD [Endozoicomonas sp. (ex Bugula neritina AB1)]|nr:16S rRNA (guanine(966)-N(2))-methyltransferase RsmD [Endozoicomonas sp. (ex Bugula neritina AB1)]